MTKEFKELDIKDLAKKAKNDLINEAARAGYQDYELNEDGEPIKAEKDPESESLIVGGREDKKVFAPLVEQRASDKKFKPLFSGEKKKSKKFIPLPKNIFVEKSLGKRDEE